MFAQVVRIKLIGARPRFRAYQMVGGWISGFEGGLALKQDFEGLRFSGGGAAVGAITLVRFCLV
jgi:hypothetical protein